MVQTPIWRTETRRCDEKEARARARSERKAIVPLWPGNTSQVRQAWVQWCGFNGFKSRVSPLLSTQTHTSLLSNFSAQGTAVVVSVKIHTYEGLG